MDSLLLWIGRVAGVGGVALCANGYACATTCN